MSVKPVPDGYHSITPYLVIDGATQALDWYAQAFGAKEQMRMPMGDRIGHAEIRIGNSIVMLADEFPDMELLGPRARGGTPVSLMLYVEDVDSVFARAVSAGAIEERAVKDEFYGDRAGTLLDPFGHRWTISTHVEDLDEAEVRHRLDAMIAEGA